MNVNAINTSSNANFGAGYYRITMPMARNGEQAVFTPGVVQELKALARVFKVAVEPIYDPLSRLKVTEVIIDKRDCNGLCEEGLASTVKRMGHFVVESFKENYPIVLSRKPRESRVPDFKFDLHG